MRSVLWSIGLLCGGFYTTAAAQPAQLPEPAPQNSAPSASFDWASALGATPNGLTSDQAAAIAARTSPLVSRAQRAVSIAEAGAARVWLNVYPRLELTGRYTRLSEVDASTIGASEDQLALAQSLIEGVEDPESALLFQGFLNAFSGFSFESIPNQFAFRAAVVYPVSDVFFRVLPGGRAADSSVEAQRMQVEAQRAIVGMQAREAYYGYLRAKAMTVVAQTAVAQFEGHRAQIQALVNAGTVARVELMRLDAQIAAARVNVARAQAGVDLAATALRTLLHLEPDSPLEIGENLGRELEVPDGDAAALLRQALRERIEMKALRVAIGAREDAVSARRGGRYPRLAIAAGVDLANPNPRVIPQEEEWDVTWDASVVLSWAFNDFLQANTEVDEAEAELAQTNDDLAALSDGIRLEVTRSLTEVSAARAALESAQVGIDAATESYRIRREQLNAGVAVTSDLIDADAELTRARLDYVNSLVDLRLAQARLRRAVGL